MIRNVLPSGWDENHNFSILGGSCLVEAKIWRGLCWNWFILSNRDERTDEEQRPDRNSEL